MCWRQLKPHPQQSALWRSNSRLVACACGRGSGKSEIAYRKIVVESAKCNDTLFAIVLPTYPQAKRVGWRKLCELMPAHWIAKKNESELFIQTIYNTRIYVCGADRPQRIEGTQWSGVVIDEASDQKPELFDNSIRPGLTHNRGWCWVVGVPKRTGIGAAWFRKFCQRPEVDYYTWPSADILPADEIAAIKATLDKQTFAEQYKAEWLTAGGAIFYAFGRDNLVATTKYDSAKELIVASDFNVDPMAWLVAQWHGDTLQILDEIWLRDANTPHTLDVLHSRWGKHQGPWLFVGDATARSRKTSASKSDYQHIMGDNRFSSVIRYDKSNPPVADRFAHTNKMLSDANGRRTVKIDAQCAHLITDLQVRAYRPGTNVPADSGDVGHITDALGYLVWNCKTPTRAGVYLG